MIIPDQKKSVTVILSKLKPEGSKEQEGLPEEVIDEHMGILKGIAEDAMQAIKDGSAHDLAVAMKSFWQEMELAEEEAEGEEDESMEQE